MTVTDPTTQSETLFVLESDGPVVDDGLFGPGSMAWKVWSHPAAFVGAVRSFMAEMLSSPEGAAAVSDFGTYKSDAIGRLQRTMQYFLTVVFADTATVDKANLRLRRMHNNIKGHTPTTNTAYSGVDPVLMLGVHLMTWHSVWVCYEALVGKQPAADEERYFVESFVAAEALQLDHLDADNYREMATARGYATEELADYEGVPTTRAGFSKTMRAAERLWCVTAQTRDIMDVLLAPGNPTDLRMSLLYRAYPIIGNAAAATLPRRMRAMASIPTSRAWETRSIAMGRAFVQAAAIPAIRNVLDSQLSPRGYELMRESLGRSAALPVRRLGSDA